VTGVTEGEETARARKGDANRMQRQTSPRAASGSRSDRRRPGGGDAHARGATRTRLYSAVPSGAHPAGFRSLLRRRQT
jgi:hypothetical protein